jgi:hypothetical protein
MRYKLKAIFFTALLSLSTLYPLAAKEQKADLIRLLKEAADNYAGVRSYTTIFYKQQRVGGTLYDEEKIQIKFKKPFMIYMKWVGTIDNGREVLYVEGQNSGKLIVRLAGVLSYFSPAFSLSPNSSLAMKKNLRPITESGIGNTINLLVEVCALAEKEGDLKVDYTGEGKLDGRKTYKFERFLPPGKGYPAHKTVLELDMETKFPLLIKSYGWDGELLESYRYVDLDVDAGLEDEDFSYRNKKYNFGRVVVPL